jgi:DUF2934 family protein
MARETGARMKRTVPAETRLPANDVERTAVSAASPTQEEIARLAYSYWEARGYEGGSPEEDWFRAERELRSKLARREVAKS